jgi:hypothetical protein
MRALAVRDHRVKEGECVIVLEGFVVVADQSEGRTIRLAPKVFTQPSLAASTGPFAGFFERVFMRRIVPSRQQNSQNTSKSWWRRRELNPRP